MSRLSLQAKKQAGGNQIRKVVRAEYADGKKAVFVYATDCEGNQRWKGAVKKLPKQKNR